METIEISHIKKLNGTFELIISFTLIITIVIVFVVIIKNLFLNLLILLPFFGSLLFSFRIRNKRLYYLVGFADYSPIFKESAIRITDEYITVKIREKPSFFIWWKDFDVIKVSMKSLKFLVFSTIKRYKLQFYAYYPDYTRAMKYISSFELKTRHFSAQKCEEIISNMQKFSTTLDKKQIVEI